MKPKSKSHRLTGMLLSPDLAEIAALSRVVLLAPDIQPLRLRNGVAQVVATSLPVHGRYVIRIATLGLLRVVPIEVESGPKGRLILHFKILTQKTDRRRSA